MNDIVRKLLAPGLIRGIDSKNRTITAYVSTNEWDRYGERFEADAFKDGLDNYLKNPVVLWAHDYGNPPIAKAIDYSFDDKGLILKMQFADTPAARDIFALYEGGFLNAFSVGFKPREVAYEERTPGKGDMGAVFKKAELLENSAVPVPANPGALVLKGLMDAACRAFGVKEPEDKPAAVPAPAPATVPAPESEPAAPAPAPAAVPEPAKMAPPDLKAALGYILGLGKMVKGQGKVTDEDLRGLLVQVNNLCRELVYGPAASPIQEPGAEVSDEEVAALVKEYELLSEALAKNPGASDADRKELAKIGDLIAVMISGSNGPGE